MENEQNMYDTLSAETKVGSKLNEEIQKNVITMILLILISIPIFNPATWFSIIPTYDKSIEQLSLFKGNSVKFDFEATIFI